MYSKMKSIVFPVYSSDANTLMSLNVLGIISFIEEQYKTSSVNETHFKTAMKPLVTRNNVIKSLVTYKKSY